MPAVVPILRDNAATYTVEELAALLKVSTVTIFRRIRAGEIATVPRTGRKNVPYRIARAEVYRLAGVAVMDLPTAVSYPDERKARSAAADERLRRHGVSI